MNTPVNKAMSVFISSLATGRNIAKDQWRKSVSDTKKTTSKAPTWTTNEVERNSINKRLWKIGTWIKELRDLEKTLEAGENWRPGNRTALIQFYSESQREGEEEDPKQMEWGHQGRHRGGLIGHGTQLREDNDSEEERRIWPKADRYGRAELKERQEEFIMILILADKKRQPNTLAG